MRFQLIPFDARASIEAAELIALIRSKHETWGSHAKVKFDIQIVATAKAEDARVIYSDDRDIENFAKRFKIPVMRICDLPLPPPKEFPKTDTGPIGEQTALFDLAPPLFITEQKVTPERPITQEVTSDRPKPESAQEVPAPSAEVGDKPEAYPAHSAPVQGSVEGRAEGKVPERAPKKAPKKRRPRG